MSKFDRIKSLVRTCVDIHLSGHPDPVGFLYDYNEVVAAVAATEVFKREGSIETAPLLKIKPFTRIHFGSPEERKTNFNVFYPINKLLEENYSGIHYYTVMPEDINAVGWHKLTPRENIPEYARKETEELCAVPYLFGKPEKSFNNTYRRVIYSRKSSRLFGGKREALINMIYSLLFKYSESRKRGISPYDLL